jgi:tRNA (adenine57-N1/adenine58-N1)-methyltransferase
MIKENKFKEGDLVIVKDEKGKTWLQTLLRKGRFQTDIGKLEHNKIIGKSEGAKFKTSADRFIFIFRPTIEEYISKMIRKTAIIHPKDIAFIIMESNIGPDSFVVEAGTGSGAMLLALVKYLGKGGKVVSYDNRKELQEVAIKNLRRFYGKIPSNVILKNKDINEGVEERDIDAIILDIPEPWQIIPMAIGSLKLGASFVSYIPTIIQAERLVKELDATKSFIDVKTVELILRPWWIKGFSVRPLHRIVGHTGFIVSTKLLKK